MTLHPETISNSQRSLLAHLGPVATEMGFYLGGGTAIALQLGHRRSDDFDWFTELWEGDALRLARRLEEAGLSVSSPETAPETLHARIEGVPVSFLAYPYEPLRSLVECAEYGCELAALDDLSCMKLAAIAQRGLRKDFVDIHALGTEHRPIEELIALYRERYGIDDVGHLLVGLSYFDDADVEAMPDMLRDVEWEDIKREIAGWVRAFA